MNLSDILLLGYSNGVSKKNNNPYFLLHLGVKMDDKFGKGYQAVTCGVTKDVYDDVLKNADLMVEFKGIVARTGNYTNLVYYIF